MKRNTFLKRTFLLITLTGLLLTGCGKDAELEEYRENMIAFTTNIFDITSRMDDINPESTDAVSELLGCLSELQEQFLVLSEMDVPNEFAAVESLADEASVYMTEAVTLFSEAYSAEEFPVEKNDAAQENYDRAMMRLSYISTLLQGELPEGENIIVTEEEILDFEPVTEEP